MFCLLKTDFSIFHKSQLGVAVGMWPPEVLVDIPQPQWDSEGLKGFLVFCK